MRIQPGTDLKGQSTIKWLRKQIDFDAGIIFSLIIYLTALLAYVFLLSPSWQEVFDNYIAEILFLTLTALLFARKRKPAQTPNVIWFRSFIAAGFAAWLLADIASLAFSDLLPAQSAIIKDVLYLIFFCCVAVAIELRLDKNNPGPVNPQLATAAIGIVLLLITIFHYFGILPLLVTNRTYATPYSLHAFLDAYFTLRFMLAAFQATHKTWRLMFAGFTVVFAVMTIADLLALAYLNGTFVHQPGAYKNLLWYTWYPIAMALSGVQLESTTETTQAREHPKLSIATSGILLFGLILPFIHVTGYAIGVFDIDSRQLRDMLVGVWVIVIAALLFGTYFYFRQRVDALDLQRLDAETKAEQYETQLNRELRIRSLGRLSAGLSHDFGNTLAAISLYESLIRKKNTSGKAIDNDLNGLAKSISYAKDIVDKLRIFGNSGEHVTSQTLNISHEVSNTIQLIRSAMPHGVELSFDKKTPELYVSAESPMVHQVVINFIYNAADALHNHGKIRVILSQKDVDMPCASCGEHFAGSYAALEVSDSGPGMTADLAKQVFEPLVSTKQAGKGSGLGLSTVHVVMHNVGGHVGLTTNVGRGARFAAYFPLVDTSSNDDN